MTNLVIDQAFIEKRPLSYSALKQFKKSPAHYYEHVTAKKVPTPALIRGGLVDCLLLTPDKFEKEYFILPEINRRTTEGKAIYEKLLHENEGKLLISQQDLDEARLIVERVKADKYAANYLNNIVETQRKMIWRNKEFDLPMIGYVDFICDVDGQKFAGEFKTTQDADPNNFERSISRFDYHLQTAVYLDAFKRIGYEFPEMIHIAVETSEPYACSVMMMSHDMIEIGKQELNTLLQHFRYCIDNQKFNEGYNYWLMETKPYYIIEMPKFHKTRH